MRRSLGALAPQGASRRSGLREQPLRFVVL